MNKDLFDGCSVLVTGGTGSFGKTVIKHLLNTQAERIIVFSRDEKKQFDMGELVGSSRIKYVIGDVRDSRSLKYALSGVDFVFHAAALKHVPSCEFNPFEAVATNILGTQNVIDACIDSRVKKLVCLSTDKAVSPVNAMGLSKALMEKLVAASAERAESEGLDVCCTRYGNVLGSRGSVVPIFLSQIKNGRPLTITNPLMSRFVMTLEESVDLVFKAFEGGGGGDVLVKKVGACTIDALADAVIAKCGLDKYQKSYIGVRPGEKMYETLLSSEEISRSVEWDGFIKVRNQIGVIDSRSFYDGLGESSFDTTSALTITDFNSDNAMVLSHEELVAKLNAVDKLGNNY